MKLSPATMSLPALMLALVLGVAATRPAHAQIDSREGIALQNQILELRQELQQLGSGAQQPPPQQEPQYAPPAGGAGAAQNGETVAQLVVRTAALEEQMRQLQGRVDDISNQLQRQNDALTKQIGDLAFKLGQGGGVAGGPNTPDANGTQLVSPGDSIQPPPMSREPNTPGPLATRPLTKRPPEIALREGNAALARRDYAAAAAAAQEVIASGKSIRGTDAQLLLARAESGQHNYRQSAADFYDAYNRAPRSGQAPVALLGVANSLLALNDGKDACQALAKLSAEFPNPPGGVKASAARAKKQAACH